MTVRRMAKAHQLQILPPKEMTLFPADGEYVADRLSPGKRVTRYGREWIVGATRNVDGILSGKIGLTGLEGLAEIWDESKKDFLPVAVPAGLTAPFAIDLEALRLVVQPRGNIKLEGLVGALRALLSTDGPKWKIEAVVRRITFGEWRRKVRRVQRVRFWVRKPNPHYHGARNLEELIEGMEAEAAELDFKSDRGLDLDSQFMEETQSHVERGYGESKYEGIDSAGRETVYRSELKAEEETIEVVADESGEAEIWALTEVLGVGSDDGEADGSDVERGRDET